jgi:hypothetical protein
VNSAGEGQDFDGNGMFISALINTGDQTVQTPNPAPTLGNTILAGNTIDTNIRTQPRIPATGMPPFKPNFKCYRNDVPNLNGAAAAVAPGTPAP